MSLDTIGGFAGNNSPKKYLHLLADHFTRYAFTVTSTNQKTPDFIKLLNIVLNKGHKIKNLLTDQYTGINSAEFKNFCKDKDINLIFTAVDSPSSNGLNERLNQTLINRLRCKINENKENRKRPWSGLLNQCVSEYNDTIHSVTKFSPNYLLNGKKLSFLEISNNVNSDLINDRKIVFENSQKSHFRNKRKFDKKRKNINFEVGDLVYVNHGNPLNKNKLQEIRIGPFKISQKISNLIYQVDSGFQKRESNVYHVSKMYPFCSI